MKLHEMFDEPRKPRRNRNQDVKKGIDPASDLKRADVNEADPMMPAATDRVKGIRLGHDPDEDFDKRNNMPNPKRRGQRAGRYLRRQHGQGGEASHAMSALEAQENETNDEGEIKSRDPRITAMLKKARVNYAGAAADDLSALVSMMNDEQVTQDHEIDDLSHHNGSQDVEIDHEEGVNDDQAIELGDLAARIKKLENERAPSRDTNEAIVPYNDEYTDDETGEIFRADQVEKGADGQYKEKAYEPEPMQYEPDDDDDDATLDYDSFTQGRKQVDPGKKLQAIGMFGDVAAGGGDPIDYIMTTLGMDMEEIDALAREQGYEDANEWAESHARNEMESIISNANNLNNR